MSVECKLNVKSPSELDIGGRETCLTNCHIFKLKVLAYVTWIVYVKSFFVDLVWIKKIGIEEEG